MAYCIKDKVISRVNDFAFARGGSALWRAGMDIFLGEMARTMLCTKIDVFEHLTGHLPRWQFYNREMIAALGAGAPVECMRTNFTIEKLRK